MSVKLKTWLAREQTLNVLIPLEASGVSALLALLRIMVVAWVSAHLVNCLTQC